MRFDAHQDPNRGPDRDGQEADIDDPPQDHEDELGPAGIGSVLLSERERVEGQKSKISELFFRGEEELKTNKRRWLYPRLGHPLPMKVSQLCRVDKQAPPMRATVLHMLGTEHGVVQEKRDEWICDLLLNGGHCGGPKKKVEKKQDPK